MLIPKRLFSNHLTGKKDVILLQIEKYFIWLQNHHLSPIPNDSLQPNYKSHSNLDIHASHLLHTLHAPFLHWPFAWWRSTQAIYLSCTRYFGGGMKGNEWDALSLIRLCLILLCIALCSVERHWRSAFGDRLKQDNTIRPVGWILFQEGRATPIHQRCV